MQWYFCFFLVSGFCSILYEVIWLRLTMAQFGVTTAVASIVLSAFMIGLGLGSWGAGRLIRRFEGTLKFPPLRLYALAELLIGISAITVPFQLAGGKQLLQRVVGAASSSSLEHYLEAGACIVLTLVPWCACMGATFPFAMLAIRNRAGSGSDRSFSYLYLANVLGALAGATIPLLLIELLGFRATLYVGAGLNILLAASAFALSARQRAESKIATDTRPTSLVGDQQSPDSGKFVWLLFGSGLTSMGVEVVWIRLYTPSVSTVVYAFATILGLYLASTYAGSWLYRRRGSGGLESSLLWAGLGFSVLVAFLTVDPRLPLPPILRVFLGVAPLSMIVGFVTPMMVDRFSSGDPDRAGRAYAVNIAGCVVGPLLSGFVLLPFLGERISLCLFALPWFVAGLVYAPRASGASRWKYVLGYSAFAVSTIALAVFTQGYEEHFHPRTVLRDDTATVIATGTGHGKRLLINGVGITTLTPITKMMAHLPLALLGRPPASALIICFGMGTSHRSALSWGIHSTAVELVPSVPELFTFFHPNGPVGLDSPLSQVVTDDGRSYLERTSDQYDIIVIDPPPPVGAAASSLLYSREFYAVAKVHLRSGGILAQWLPGGDAATRSSVARAMGESFPYVRVFGSLEHEGFHLLGSMTPIASAAASELAGRLPAAAASDLIEWGPASTPAEQFQAVLNLEMPLSDLIQEDAGAPALQDDRPINEYFLIRKLSEPGYWKKLPKRLLGNASPPMLPGRLGIQK
jgi:predicted membrane-bound spermidine synthase